MISRIRSENFPVRPGQSTHDNGTHPLLQFFYISFCALPVSLETIPGVFIPVSFLTVFSTQSKPKKLIQELEDMMSKKETAWNWGFGFKWLVGCTLGTAVFGTLAYLSMWTIAEVIGDLTTELLGTMTAGLLFGGFFAFGGTLGPGWLLQGQGISAKSWIGQSVVVTAVAMSVSIALITSLFEVVPEPVSALFMGLVLGLPMGLVQGRLLRQSAIPSTWWPLINIAGYLCAAFIIVFFSGEGREWMIIIMGLLLGVDTGLGMMWLQREAAAHDLISYAD